MVFYTAHMQTVLFETYAFIMTSACCVDIDFVGHESTVVGIVCHFCFKLLQSFYLLLNTRNLTAVFDGVQIRKLGQTIQHLNLTSGQPLISLV